MFVLEVFFSHIHITSTLQGVPNGRERVPLSNPLGFKHHPLEGPGIFMHLIIFIICFPPRESNKTHLTTTQVVENQPFCCKEQTRIHDFLPPNSKTMPRCKLCFHFHLIQYRIDLLQQINTINTLGVLFLQGLWKSTPK